MAPTTDKENTDGHSIGRNAYFLLVGRALGILLSIVQVLYLARLLGAESFGIYVFAAYFASLFTSLGDLGLSNLLTKDLSRARTQATAVASRIITLKLALSTAVWLIGFVVLIALDYPSETLIIVNLRLLGRVFFGSLLYAYYHIFEGLERMAYVAIFDLTHKFLDLIACLILFELGFTLSHYMGVLILIEGVLLLCAVGVSWSHLGVPFRLNIDWRNWGNLIRTALPYGLILVFFEMMTTVDTTILSKIRSPLEVGFYGASVRVVSVLSYVPLMVGSAMFPTVARVFHESPDSARPIFSGVIRAMILIGIPVAVGTTLLSQPIINLIYGEAYEAAANPLVVLAWAVGIYYVSTPLVLLLNAIDRQHYATGVVGFAALANVLLNFLLIPFWGPTGAAVATLIAQIAILMLSWKEITRLWGKIGVSRYWVQGIAAAAVMALFVFPFRSYPVVPVVIFGAAAYLGCLILVGGFTRNDWQWFKKIANYV